MLKTLTCAAAYGALLFTTATPVLAAQQPSEQAARAEQLRRVAAEAYIYLYPLVTMEVTRLVQFDPRYPAQHQPNHLHHARAFPEASFRAVVRPNFDTLYSSAWIDLGQGPVLMTVPASKGRYYLLQFQDMWTDTFAVPGSRTSGNDAATFALVPKGWRGVLPKGAQRIESPTRWVWLIGRSQTNGVADYGQVHAFQDGMEMKPLAKAKPAAASRAPFDIAVPPKERVDTMPAMDFLTMGARLMAQTGTHLTDWSQVERMRRAGIAPGFSAASLTAADRAALEQGIADGRALLNSREAGINPRVNGWAYGTETVGVYGNHYLKRAITARRGLGANPPEDAVYLNAYADAAGQALKADKRYVIHFDADKLPPAGAFWSVTLYNGEGFPVANPINRFALGDRDKLAFNPDGSLDILIQSDDPGGKASANWLPSGTTGAVSLSIRIYEPRDSVLGRQWVPPAVIAQ